MNEKIQKARIALLLDQPFFATIAFQLPLVEDKNCPTMCTDGNQIRFGTDFVNQCSVRELATVFAHEIMHVVLFHPWRMKGKNPMVANIAGDIVINNDFDKANEKAKSNCQKQLPFPFPQGGGGPIIDHKFDGLCMEEVYNRLMKNAKKVKGGGCMGGFEEAKSSKPEEGEQRVRGLIASAAAAAKLQGKLPAHLERLIEENLNPPANWREILRQFVTIRSQDDYSWNRPNRRFMPHGLYFPSLDGQRMGKVSIGFDSSGSTEGILGAFLRECQAVLDEVRPEVMEIVQCDAEIQEIRTFEPGDLIRQNFKMKGGGGTDFRPVFQHWEDNPPVCAVYLTDLYGSFPANASFPTLWAATTDQPVPFGEIVRIKE